MLKTTKIVGLNSDKLASQAFSIDDKLFLIICCEGEDAFSKTRALLPKVEELLQNDLDAAAKITQVFETVDFLLQDTTSHQLLVALLTDKDDALTLDLLYSGDGLLAYLQRDGSQSDLFQPGEERELISISLLPKDRLVLATKSLLELLKEDFSKLFTWQIDTVVDEVGPYLPEAEVNPVAGIILENSLPAVKMLPVSGNNGQQMSRSAFLRSNLRYLFLVGFLVVALLVIFAYQKFIHKKVTLQKGEVSQPAATAVKKIQVDKLPVWLDLQLIKKGFSAEVLSLSTDKLLLLDNGEKTLASLNIKTKAAEILAGKIDLGQATLFYINGDQAFVYSYDKGIVRVDLNSKEVKVVVKKDEDWGNINQIYAFAGNIYLLDNQKSKIYKYLPIASGYSDKRDYLSASSRVDLKDATRMQIDSSVWVLKKDGQILRFTQGNSDFFSYSGLEKPIKEPKSFFVSSETDNLYLLDSGNSRLLVLNKKGGLVTAYENPQFKDFIDLVVDEEGKKAYLLEGSKIYLLELR